MSKNVSKKLWIVNDPFYRKKNAEIWIILKLAPFTIHLLLFHIQWASSVLATKQQKIKGWVNISEYSENTIAIGCVNNLTMVEIGVR